MQSRSLLAALLAIAAGALPGQQASRTSAPAPGATRPTEPTPAHAGGIPTLAALLENLRLAYALDAKPRAIEALRTRVDVASLEKGKSVTFTLAVSWKAPDLLRYEVLEGETKKEQGIDEEGEWEAVGRAVSDLREARVDTALLQVQQNLRICKQIVRLVDPRALLESLQEKTQPKYATVKLSDKEPQVRCIAVAGRLREFPLFRQRKDGMPGSVHCELFFEEAGSRLRALRVTPVDDDKRVRGATEWIVLHNLQPQDGFLLPKGIVIYEATGTGLELLAKVEIGATRWNPPLTAANFRRPAR